MSGLCRHHPIIAIFFITIDKHPFAVFYSARIVLEHARLRMGNINLDSSSSSSLFRRDTTLCIGAVGKLATAALALYMDSYSYTGD